MKIRSGVLGMIAAVAFVILACGGDASPSAGTSVAEPVPAITQELRVNLGGEPSSLDPQLATALPEFSVIRQVLQGLLGFNPELGLEPVVATQVPTVENGGISADGLVYTFRLREDATWTDGENVTAGDFAYAIKRLLDPEVAAPYAHMYSAVKGAMEYNSAVDADAPTRQALRDAVAVEAPDQYTLRVTLEAPNPTFLQKMALVSVYPVRRDLVEGFQGRWTETGNFVGKGPFVMTEWVHQDHITLEANPNYWGDGPKLDKITYRMITDPNAELAAYRNGELDLSQVPVGTEGAILADPAQAKEVIRAPQLFTFGLFFNTSVPPFDDVRVRQAFATAIDREAWIDKVKNGVGRPATSWLPPEMPGYDPEVGKEYTFDPEAATRLLGENGHSNGNGSASISFTYVDAGDGRVMAQFIQAQIKDNLGIDLTLDPLDPPAYFQQVLGARQFELTGIGWGADYPSPETFLAPFFATGAGQNIVQYSNPDFDQLAELASLELDQQLRPELWARAHAVVLKEVPVVPFFHGERFFLKKPIVRGLTLTGVDGAIPGDTRLHEVFLAP